MKTSLTVLEERRDALSCGEAPELFAGEREDFDSALHWLEDFAREICEKTPTDLVHSLAQLGVHDPHHGTKMDLHTDHMDEWFKMYRWHYNTAVYDLIHSVPGLMQKMRDVIRRDLKRTGKTPGYGSILLKEAGHAYLNFFLRPFPAWCITQPWETEELVTRLNQEQAEFFTTCANSVELEEHFQEQEAQLMELLTSK